MDGINLPRLVGAIVGLVVVGAGITMMFLGMRAVMDIGGSCASGGPYVIENECPTGTGALMMGGLVAVLVGAGIYSISAARLPGPNLVLVAWSGMFLALGWNFWEFGLNPPAGSGTDWGWIICGVVFVLLGAAPLLGAVGPKKPKPSIWTTTLRTGRGPQPGPQIIEVPSWIMHADAPVDPRGADSRPDVSQALERLAELHRRGELTDDEYSLAKQQLLGDA